MTSTSHQSCGLLQLLLCFVWSVGAVDIYVDPNNTNSINNSSCYTLGRDLPCADINFALASPFRESSTTFYLSPSATHCLEDNAVTTVFDGALLVAFAGDSGTAVVECMDGAGLAFVNSTSITFENVSFRKCGAWRNSTNKEFYSRELKLMQFRVSLYFYNCRNVRMVNMSVLNSTEAMGVVMYSTAGVNIISHSQFDGNRINESNRNESGGGGFVVEFNYCKPGDNSCNSTNHQTENNQNATYVFEHCSFSYNRAIDQTGPNNSYVSILPHNETHSILGRGGGLTLYFKSNATRNSITVAHCLMHRNHATWGAGLMVEFADTCIQNSVNVINGTFTNNHCYHSDTLDSVGGGSMYVGGAVYYITKADKSYTRNSVFVKGCDFIDNIAILGGALSLMLHRQRLSHTDQLFQVNVSETSFVSNSAHLGSAVSIRNDHFFTEGELGKVIFDSCSFTCNTIMHTGGGKPHSVGIGAIYICEISVTFMGRMTFTENNGTALALAGTDIMIDESTFVTFHGNHGSKGGAIALLGMAALVIGKNTGFIFENNSATLYGGAIYNDYIGKEDLHAYSKCFIQYYKPLISHGKWQTEFIFKGNRAERLGHSIFSSTILPCLWSHGMQVEKTAVSEIFCWNTSIWVYDNNSCAGEINTYPQLFNLDHAKNMTFPGHEFHLHIDALDDLGNDVSSNVIYTAATNSTSPSDVDPGYTYIAGGAVIVTGMEDQNLTLELNTATSRDWHLQLNLKMFKCPPGFVLSNDREQSKSVCECLGGPNNLYTFSGNLLCDKASLISKIRNGHWIGYAPAARNDSVLLLGPTSLLYDYTHQEFSRIARRYKRLDYNQCSHLHRTGPLCGECIDGYSTAVNSYNYECVPCTGNTTNLAANIAIYVSLTYLPYLIVFIVIIYFDVRLMSGPLVGFILYAQLIGSGVVDLTTNNLPYHIEGDFLYKMRRAYRIVYGVFNMNSLSELLDPFCVHQNFTALDVISLDYAMALFPLLLILVIYVLSPLRSIRLRQRRRGIRNISTARSVQRSREVNRKSLIHPFVGFIYLSYTKFALTSTKLLSCTSLINEAGDGVVLAVNHAGHYYFGQIEYILPYGLIAIVTFAIVGVFLPLLLLGPLDFMNWLADKCNVLNKCWPSLRINTYLDAFHGCYKPSRRHFIGMYFMFRTITFVSYAFSPNELIGRVWQLVFLIILISLVSRFNPYKVSFLNYLDLCIFFILTVIHLLSIYLITQHTANVQSHYPLQFYSLGLTCLWLPLVYLPLYFCWLVVHKSSMCQCIVERLQPLSRCWAKYCDDSGTEEERRPLLNPASRGKMRSMGDDVSDDGLSDASLFERAKESSKYRPPPQKTSNTGSSADGTTGEFGTGSSGISSGMSTSMASNVESSGTSNIKVTSTNRD